MGSCVICGDDTNDCCPLCDSDCCSSCVTEELCMECTNPNCDGPYGTQSCCELCIINANCADLPQCDVPTASDDPEDCDHPNATFNGGNGMMHCPDCLSSWQEGGHFDDEAGHWTW